MESSGSEAGSEIGRANDSHYDSSPSATRPVSTEPTACNLRLTPADKTTEQRTHREGERSPSQGSTLSNNPPTGTVPPPLCTIKPDPEDSPVAAASGKRTPLSAAREDAENGGEEEDSFCNGEAINIADLVDTVISEEMQLAKDRCRRQPLIQVRSDIIDVGNNSSNSSSSAFSVVASAADRGLDLTWPAAAASRTQSASSSLSSSPHSQLDGERQQQAAILRYPGGPPEGRHLYLPAAAAANQSFNLQIGVATTTAHNGSPRHINGSQSPSGLDSMLNGGLRSSGRIPPPLIR
jgi:hypothetical protein